MILFYNLIFFQNLFLLLFLFYLTCFSSFNLVVHAQFTFFCPHFLLIFLFDSLFLRSAYVSPICYSSRFLLTFPPTYSSNFSSLSSLVCKRNLQLVCMV
jgi:hypothetical protein